MLSDRLMALIRNPVTPHYVIRDAVMEEETPVPKVYVVVGSTGEHSDWRTWLVAGYLDKDHAVAMREKLKNWCELHGVWDNPKGVRVPIPKRSECPFDPNFCCDFTTGTKYLIEEIPLRVEE